MIKVSVIIPVYNVEQYLRPCLDSVLNQTLKNIEIICIDDGSTDDSLKILMEYAEKDNRITILKQKNKGAGVARNYGMSIATGEYFLFLDSDDFFSETLLMDSVQKADDDDADIAIYKFEKFNQQNQAYISCEYAFCKMWWPNRVFNKYDNPEKIFNSFSLCAWNKLFRASFVRENKLYFQDNMRTNDLFFTCSAMAVANRITLVDKVLAYYRVGLKTNSQSTNHIALFDFYKALLKFKNFLQERDLYELLQKSYFSLVISTCIYNITNNEHNNGMRILNFLNTNGYKELEVEKPDIDSVNNIFQEDYKKYKFKKSLCFKKEKRNLVCMQESAKKEYKVSVIIPVYNVERYLSECLDSVLQQSLCDIELICVNDGAEDGSLSILQEYASKNTNFTLLSQDNWGLSVARNTGVEFAKGKYLYFLDSDDKLCLEALEKLYKKSEENKLDVLYFDAESFFENEKVREENKGYENYYRRHGNYETVVGGKTLFVKMVENNEYRTSVQLHFINKNYYDQQQLSFVPGLLHEDNIFSFECMLNAERVAHIREALFLRRIRANSIMTNKRSFANVYGYFVCALKLMVLVKKLELNEIENNAASKKFKELLNTSRNIYMKLPNEEKKLLDVLNPLEAEVLTRTLIVKRAKVPKQRVIEKYGSIALIGRVKQSYKDYGLKVTISKAIAKLRSEKK